MPLLSVWMVDGPITLDNAVVKAHSSVVFIVRRIMTYSHTAAPLLCRRVATPLAKSQCVHGSLPFFCSTPAKCLRSTVSPFSAELWMRHESPFATSNLLLVTSFSCHTILQHLVSHFFPLSNRSNVTVCVCFLYPLPEHIYSICCQPSTNRKASCLWFDNIVILTPHGKA